MSRVLILYTGGTIGMVPSAKGYVPQPGFADRLRKCLADQRLPEYEVLELDEPLDSASLVPADWSRLGKLLQRHWQDYDGFVILHGTDTLSYTASALSYMLPQQDKPVVMTGSQIPLSQVRNDAVDNLTSALLLASGKDVAEVCVCFNGLILRGNRSRKVDSTALNAFDSPNFSHLGQMGIDLVLRRELLLAPQPVYFDVPEHRGGLVAMLGVYPGMESQLLASLLSQESLRGVVLSTYGVGNLPADTRLLQVLADAREQGITVVNISQCHRGNVSQGAYATGYGLNDIGVLPGGDMTPEATFTKLNHLLASNLGPEEVYAAMRNPLRGECSMTQFA